MTIKPADTSAEIEAVRRLFMEYEAFLDVDLCFQDFEEELAGLPGKYAPPGGILLVGLVSNTIEGCVAVRKLTDDVCEMKRLYVRDAARGSGLGRLLAQTIITTSKDMGYAAMRLDTLDRLTEAMNLYQSLGFAKVAPYYENPLPGVVYWELNLRNG